MFFTYVKSDEVIGPYVDHVKCEQCSKANLHLRGKFSYLVVELFNLPLFMLKRRYEFSCDCGHCQIPNQKSQLFKQLKQQMLPWWYFATKHVGFLLFLLLTAWFYSQHLQTQQLRKSLIASPQVNDFYFVDYHQINPDSNPIYRYTTLKVTAIEADKVSFVVGSVFLKHN